MVIAPQTAPITFPMLLGQMTFGITGAASAAIRGGDIGEGMLFGVIAGSAVGLSLGAMGPLPGAEAGAAHVWGAMAEGAIVGTAGGATAAYGGGKGSIQETIFWAAMGNISGATLSGIGAALKAANPSTQEPVKINEVIEGRDSVDIKQKLSEFGYDVELKISDNLNVEKGKEIFQIAGKQYESIWRFSVFDADAGGGGGGGSFGPIRGPLGAGTLDTKASDLRWYYQTYGAQYPSSEGIPRWKTTLFYIQKLIGQFIKASPYK